MKTVNLTSEAKSFNSSQTKKLGEILAKEALKTKPGKKALVFALQGELGSGKTTFIQGFARGLGVKGKVRSPTFIIFTRYKIQDARYKNFYHIDCYRLKKTKEILRLGFKKIIADPRNIIAVEWAEKISKAIPDTALKISFRTADKRIRTIIVSN